MKSNNKLKETNMKTWTCYCLDDIFKFEDFDLDNVLIDEKSCENFLLYKLLLKTLIGAKPLRIRFDKGDEFIRDYDGTRYLVLLGAEKYDSICNRIRYRVGTKSGITYVVPHNYARVKVACYDFLPLEQTLTFHNVIDKQ